MIREQLNTRLKESMKQKDTRATATMRLMLAALKDRDIAARSKGNTEGIDEQEILQMMQTMIKQRRESIEHYEAGGRCELAEQEAEEIAVIQQFMPEQIEGEAQENAVRGLIKEAGASSIKDMGRIMSALREKYAGQMDFGRASAIVKAELS